MRAAALSLFCVGLSACNGGQTDEKVVLPTVAVTTDPVDGSGGATEIDNAGGTSATEVVPVVVPDYRSDTVYPGLVEGLQAGRGYTIALDACEVDDEGWVGQADDYLGRLACGESYTLSFSDGEWSSTGVDEYHRAADKEEVVRTINKRGAVNGNGVYIWGVRLVAEEDGRVFDRKGRRVGTISQQ